MVLSVALPASAATAVTIAASEMTRQPWNVVVTVGAICGALIAIAHFLHLPEMMRDTRNFLSDWKGAPARPGVEAIPGIPERMAKVERRGEDLHHNLSVELNGRMDLVAHSLEGIQGRADENKTALERLDERLTDVDTRINARITDHRRRNDQTIELLQDAVRQQAEDRQIIDAARAILTELGHDGDLPMRRTDERDDR